MKKSILLTAFISLLSITFSQVKSDTNKIYHNEFGIDVTGFARQFLTFGQNPASNNVIYYLTYRRMFSSGNIRSGLGADFRQKKLRNPYNSLDSNKYNLSILNLNYRIGWEFVSELSKRWQVYYGLDFKLNTNSDKNDASITSNSYITGIYSSYQMYGISPLVGFRFRLNERLSLTTEASFSIFYSEYKEKRTFKPQSSVFAEVPDQIKPTSKEIYTSFSQPISIILTFDL